MKYLIQLITYAIGTLCFLLTWYFIDRILSGFFGDTSVATIAAFIIGLLFGWVIDALLVSFLPKKYR